jgi:pilus assembly protein CpaC
MHRTYSVVPRLLGCWSLVLALLLLCGHAATAQAPFQPARFDQGPPDIKQDVPVVTLTVGTTQLYQAKDNLKRVENNNSKVLNVTAVPKEFDKVRFEGLATGRARVTLTDQKDRVELIDVVIISDRVKELREAIARTVPTGSVSVNSTDSGNTIVVSGTVMSADDARVIQQLAASVGGNVINNVHIGGVQQVQLEVVIAVVNRSEARNMSFSFTSNSQNWFAASIFGAPFSFANTLAAGAAGSASDLTQTGVANIPFGILNSRNSFLGFLQALRTENLAKILAEPRITTLSGRPAYIVSGGETPLLTSSGQGAPTISYKQFGTVVNFLPVVLGNGKIHLEVRPELSDIDNTLGISIPGITPTIIPGFRTRSAQVAIQMEDGQTLAIGGLIQNNINATISRVPVLGDLPYLGVAFTSKQYTETEQELVILVTPRLVDPVDCTKIPRYLPGRESRSPDDFELFLEGIMEAPRGPRNVSLHPRSYEAAYKNSPSIGLYPCGDLGNGGIGCAQGNCAPGQASSLAMPAGTSRFEFARPMTSPSFPEGSASNVREGHPSLGPVSATPTSREPMPRPVLPPVNSLPPR